MQKGRWNATNVTINYNAEKKPSQKHLKLYKSGDLTLK
jgi:hypothetical protein